MTTSRSSLISNLKNSFDRLQDIVYSFLSDIRIHTNNNRFQMGEFSGVNINQPSCSWEKLTMEQEKQHIEICKYYKKFIETLDGLVAEQGTNRINMRYSEIKKEFETWIFLLENFVLDNSPSNNKKKFIDISNQLKDIVNLFQSEVEVIIVPDTNALLTEPDPIKYKSIVKEESFIFLLLPTVISELDKMKMEYRESKVKEKAKKIIKRIKGWRNQGKITEGVTVGKTISLRAEVLEPIFKQMPSWLNRENNDDIIIMYILDIQRRFPSATVILVSRDINMQNKAEHAMIQCVDIEFQKEDS